MGTTISSGLIIHSLTGKRMPTPNGWGKKEKLGMNYWGRT